MLVGDLFRLSFHNLLLHKMRSLLTSLGVIFGVGSVIAMLGISEGARLQALSQIEAMGIDKIILHSQKPPVAGTSQGSSNISRVEIFGLTKADFKHINQMDNVEFITPVRDSRQNVSKGLIRVDSKLVSASPAFLTESGSIISKGRWLTQADSNSQQMVCVIGNTAKRRLFNLGETDLVGKTLRVGNQYFRIVGILENHLGTQYPGIGSPNDLIIIPEGTSDALYSNYAGIREGGQNRVEIVDYDLLIVKIRDTMHIDDTSKRISAYLTKSHKKTRDWGILVPYDLLLQQEQTQNIFTIVMASIAGISLIVGGIGIMNIMLASVFERRKEIGTRRALGALKGDILGQFLIETVFLTTMGGIIGIGVGVSISSLITYYTGMPTFCSLWSILLSLLISSFVGIVFGTYPAWKAANQNVIEVLRAE
jgi:putative ABC transport system permease protein